MATLSRYNNWFQCPSCRRYFNRPFGSFTETHRARGPCPFCGIEFDEDWAVCASCEVHIPVHCHDRCPVCDEGLPTGDEAPPEDDTVPHKVLMTREEYQAWQGTVREALETEAEERRAGRRNRRWGF